MKLKLTIDKQPLILELEAIIALFGKTRTIEFAEGRWTPYVFLDLAEPVGDTKITHITGAAALEAFLKTAPKHIVDFGGFIRDKIEEIERGSRDGSDEATVPSGSEK